MKKKTRTIVVETRRYEWTVVEEKWPMGKLKVWSNGKKNELYLDCEVLVSEPVTPSDVAAAIRNKNLEK